MSAFRQKSRLSKRPPGGKKDVRIAVMQRQLIFGTMIAGLLFVMFSLIFFFAFPLTDWTDLWKHQIFHLPFILGAPMLAIIAGIAAGLVSGYYWRSILMTIAEVLASVENGQAIPEFFPVKLDETDAVMQHILTLRRQIAEQTKISQKLASEKVEFEEKAIQKIVSEERNRLARELHDSVSQQLFAASMLMSTINETRPAAGDQESRRLKLVEETIHQSQLEMRALFLHLRPVQLHGKALKDGMEELLRELRQKVPMKINWKIEPISTDKGIEDHLFRILQESVSNTLRHAQADSLDVLLIKREPFIILRIADDGIGFDINQAKTGSYGLQNIRERAAQIGGMLKIVSMPNKGTVLEIKVPIMEAIDND